jgi:hypothetical protein
LTQQHVPCLSHSRLLLLAIVAALVALIVGAVWFAFALLHALFALVAR